MKIFVKFELSIRVLTVCLINFATVSIASEPLEYRWTNSSDTWCLSLEQKNFHACIPFKVAVESLRPGSILFVQELTAVRLPIRILFVLDHSPGISGIVETDDQTHLVEEHSILGATAKLFRVGSGSVLELALPYGIRADFIGDDVDELINAARLVVEKWSQ